MRALFLALLLLAAEPVTAQCRLALILALDISSSVDATERYLQIEGVAQALEDATVQEALFAIPGAPVALMVFEWSGSWDQTPVQEWVLIDDPGDIPAITERLRHAPRSRNNLPTAIGHALIYAKDRLSDAPACAQQKIDVSGDGRSNDGVRPERIYQLFDWSEITVNGLAIESDVARLTAYYRGAIIHGDEAFVETAAGFEDFAETMRRKLIRELGLVRLGMSK